VDVAVRVTSARIVMFIVMFIVRRAGLRCAVEITMRGRGWRCAVEITMRGRGCAGALGSCSGDHDGHHDASKPVVMAATPVAS
jgi:hypothetical protein